MTLPADKRVKVAEACTGYRCEVIKGVSQDTGGIMIHRGGGDWAWWNPCNLGVYELGQKDALVQKVAQMIQSKYNDLAGKHLSVVPAEVLDTRLREILASNNTDDLENLCYELLEGEK